MWYRDEAARSIGKPFSLVDWEYSIDAEKRAADRIQGFTPARVAVSVPSTPWERAHAHQTGLFDVDTFTDLVHLQQALWDANSSINLFAVAPGPHRKQRLLASLRSPHPPQLEDVLEQNELLIDLTVGMDLNDWTSITVASLTDQRARLETLSTTFNTRVRTYESQAPSIPDVPTFLHAMAHLAARLP